MLYSYFEGFLPISQPEDVINYIGECDWESDFLCGLCKGDCDNDSDCEGDLVCSQRDTFEAVEGCTGEGGARDVYAQDVCRALISKTYEAEDASKYDGKIENAWNGYTGSGYVNMGGQGSWIEWRSIDSGNDRDSCKLDFRYTLGDTNNRQCDLQVTNLNGASSDNYTVSFEPTGSWGYYGHKIIPVACSAGVSKIRLTASTIAGGPNVDSLTVSY